jgi:hypothetical protein
VTAPPAPKAMANRLSHLLTQVRGPDRFPVAVAELAVEYSRQCFPGEPIAKVQGEDLEGFEGMLTRHPSGTKWLLLYNSGSASEGRRRFTIAHEFGHYLLHRHRPARSTAATTTLPPAAIPRGTWRARRTNSPPPS